MWDILYGKLSTVIFYAVAILLVLWCDMDAAIGNVFLGISTGAILIAFWGYMRLYISIIRKQN